MCSSASTNLIQSPITSEMPPTPQRPRQLADVRLMRPRSVFHGGVLGLAAVTAPIHPALPGQPGDPADRLLRLRALAHRLELEGAAAGESVVSNGSPTLSRSPDFPHSPLPSPRSHLTPRPAPKSFPRSGFVQPALQPTAAGRRSDHRGASWRWSLSLVG